MNTPPIIKPVKKETEKQIETYLFKQVKQNGGYCLKFTSSTMRGVADRLVLMPNIIVFVELKTTSGRLSAHQKVFKSILSSLGLPYIVIRSKKGVDAFINSLDIHTVTKNKTGK